MIEATGSPREAASVLFDLPGYRVLDAVDRSGALRQVIVTGIATEAPCPSCAGRRLYQWRHRATFVIAGATPLPIVGIFVTITKH